MGKPINGNIRVKRLEYTKAEIEQAIKEGIIKEGQSPRKNIAKVLEVAEDVTLIKKGDMVLVKHFEVFPYEDEKGKENAYEIISAEKVKYII